MKRIAVLLTHPVQYYSPVFEKLNSKGFDVKVFYTLGDPNKKFDQDFGREVVWDVPLLKGYQFEFLKNISPDPGFHRFTGINNPNIIQKILDFNPDAIMVYGWNYQSHLRVIRYFKGKMPVVFRGDSTLLDERFSFKTLLRRFFLTWIYKHIDYAFYVGANNRQYFLKHGMKSNQLMFVPHSINSNLFNPEHINKNKIKELKNKFSIKANDKVFLYVGKFESKKDPLLLVNAFCRMKIEGAKLLMIGDGVLKNEIQSLTNSNIHIVGFVNQSELIDYYSIADVMVLPSKGPGETWGLVLNEAMSMGLAVIASDKVGGAKDLVSHGNNGYVFTSGDEVQLFKVMTEITDDNNLTSFKNKSEEIIRDYSIDAQVEAMKKYFNQIIENKNG